MISYREAQMGVVWRLKWVGLAVDLAAETGVEVGLASEMGGLGP